MKYSIEYIRLVPAFRQTTITLRKTVFMSDSENIARILTIILNISPHLEREEYFILTTENPDKGIVERIELLKESVSAHFDVNVAKLLLEIRKELH